MLLNVLSNGQRLTVLAQNWIPDAMANALNSCNAPFYTCDDNKKQLLEKHNCNKENIEFANAHSLYVKASKKVYTIVLCWWAGKQVLACFDNYDEAMQHLTTRRQCYHGNGSLILQDENISKWIEVDSNILEKIVNTYDGVHNTISFKYE